MASVSRFAKIKSKIDCRTSAVILKKRANRSETWLSCDQTKKTSIPAIRRLLAIIVLWTAFLEESPSSAVASEVLPVRAKT